MEGLDGTTVISRDKARREKAWITLEESFAKGERIQGSIFGRVKGGFTVDLSGAMAFLPGSQVDVRPIQSDKISECMQSDPVQRILTLLHCMYVYMI